MSDGSAVEPGRSLRPHARGWGQAVVGEGRRGVPNPKMIVGAHEIAERLKVKPNTVAIWKHKDATFPAPVFVVSGYPGWWWPDVEAWAKSTNRLPG